jgi:hypothetical protein
MGESSIKWTTNCVFFGSNYKYHTRYHKNFNYIILLGYDIEANMNLDLYRDIKNIYL